MRIILSLPILVAVLSMVLEGAAPAQAAPDTSSILDKLKEFGSTLEDKVRATAERIKQSDIPKKTRTWFLDTYSKVKEKLKTTFS